MENRRRLDPSVECVEAWAWIAQFRPLAVADAVFEALASTPICRSRAVEAVAKGKHSGHPRSSQVRLIVPLFALRQIADAVLSNRLHRELAHILPVPAGCWIGARPGTQPLDIAHGCSLVMEKGGDMGGTGAMAQLDVRAFYETVPTIKCCRWLEAKVPKTATDQPRPKGRCPGRPGTPGPKGPISRGRSLRLPRRSSGAASDRN